MEYLEEAHKKYGGLTKLLGRSVVYLILEGCVVGRYIVEMKEDRVFQAEESTWVKALREKRMAGWRK